MPFGSAPGGRDSNRTVQCQTYFTMGWGGWGKGKDGKGGGGGWSPWQPMFMKWGKGKGFGKADQIAAQY
eukprot:Skav228289  [mRNA]  locus=scaffold1313:199321:200411:+ [translate_table: standard]